MTTLSAWVQAGINTVCEDNGFRAGERLIVTNRTLTLPRIDASITPASVGFTGYKMKRLHSQYFVEEAVTVAMELHQARVNSGKYGSSGFHTYGHLLKSDPDTQSRIASDQGPCLQSVVMTLIPHDGAVIDVYCRSTEWFKKFAADVCWLRDRILPIIPGQDRYPITEWRFHFAGVTLHPAYLPVVLTHRPDAVATLERLRYRNPRFWGHTMRWLTAYIVGGAAGSWIEKFSQARRTGEGVRREMSDEVRQVLIAYIYRHREAAVLGRNRGEAVQAIADAWDDLR